MYVIAAYLSIRKNTRPVLPLQTTRSIASFNVRGFGLFDGQCSVFCRSSDCSNWCHHLPLCDTGFDHFPRGCHRNVGVTNHHCATASHSDSWRFYSHLIFNIPLSKLYTISMMSSLNARGGWKFSNQSGGAASEAHRSGAGPRSRV